MSENTKIEWCDHSWSPWRGCTKVSAGCANCYAETLSKRNPAVLGQWGKGKPRVLAKNWRDPVKWDRAAALREAFLEGQGGNKVFPSLCDWLDDEVPIEWLARFIGLIYDTPNLTWLLLTKRPELWRERINRAIAVWCDCEWSTEMGDYRNWLTKWVYHGIAPPNVWVGTSVEDQANADRRIPALLRIPAAGRFLSLEPLLGPVDIRLVPDLMKSFNSSPHGWHNWLRQRIQWAIIGGESGHGARPCNVEWVRALVRQGKAAGVPTFVKQLGARPILNPCRQHHFDWRHNTSNAERPDDKLFTEDGEHWRIRLNHPKGGDPAEWRDDLRVREFPEGLR